MYIILLILAIIPFFYKFSFWLYTIQLKEYRWDRFKEYLTTKQGKTALQNFWLVMEIPLLFLTFLILINPSMYEGVVTFVMFYFLLLQNIFILGKIFRKKLLYPKLTQRIIILSLIILAGISLDIYFITNDFQVWTYSYIMTILIFSPVVILLCDYISQPIVRYKKNKLIQKAILKSKSVNNTTKIGITGSYGKSSVKEILAYILEQEGETLKTPENINTELGVSSIILSKLTNKYKYFIAEMGAYKQGEISVLGEIVNHKYGFLTAIGNQHLGLFGGIENTKKAKFELAKKVIENDGVIYINGDDDNINDALSENLNGSLKGLQFIKYGLTHNELDAFSDNIDLFDGYTNFDFHYKSETHKFKTNLIGKHNILNTTGVLAFCIDMGINYESLKKYLKDLKLPKNTLQVCKIKEKEIVIIDDSYNLSESGLFAGIEVLNSFVGEKILVLDDILELGKDASIIHYNIGLKIAEENLVDKLLYVGINYKNDFISGLNKGNFGKENIIVNLDKIKEKSIILFEGRKTNEYIKKINAHVQ